MTIVTSAVDMSGVNTGFAAIAAETFGLAPEQMRVVTADTASGPYAGASGGSKVTYTVGTAVLRAAEAARDALLAAASEELEIAPADLEVVDGVVRAVGAPDRSITVEEIAKRTLRFGGRHKPIEGHGGSAQTMGAPAAAAHLAHVRVDRETGEIELLGYAVAQDVGRALNPALVDGQLRGGAVQAMGWALFEELAHDEAGRLLTGSFLDYALPTAERVPDIDTLVVEVPAPDGPFGAKGIGEAPVVPGPAAIANAVAAAVGIRMRELPMTPPRVWKALGEAETAGVDCARDAVRSSRDDRRRVRGRASSRDSAGGVPVRRTHASRRRHRRDAGELRGAHLRSSTATASRAPSSSASTSPTASPASACRTTARSPTRAGRTAGSSPSCAST